MTNFNEHALEMSIMELFEEEQYEYIRGDKIHRERTEILLCDDLKQYLYNKYSKDGITAREVDSIILMLKNISGSIYEANKAVYKMISDGFILNREDRTQKDLFIQLIDFDTPENNIFKVVNQFEIKYGTGEHDCRIPDGIVFINAALMIEHDFQFYIIIIIVFIFQTEFTENGITAFHQLNCRSFAGCIFSNKGYRIKHIQFFCNFLQLVFFIFTGFLGFCHKIDCKIIAAIFIV